MATEIARREMAERVGANIRKRRVELKLNKRELAERFAPGSAVDQQRISDWERGVNQPSERYLPELVKALEWDDPGPLYGPLGGSPDLIAALSPDDVAGLLGALDSKLDHALDLLGELLALADRPSRKPDSDTGADDAESEG